ncbi:neuronal acetylcholine receptor subunit alpha-10-like [Neopsephotus bourkii]|uniref:neuronal acetylcholine receptor subunit alpha-10-like n=1 Tax=Neopsephotus bourkii TaxID=309878 RepID=UPI002AA52715|nr:neuronal acetylcholine receptor subunit alpha-10-like [Neopsephotus bourkii]
MLRSRSRLCCTPGSRPVPAALLPQVGSIPFSLPSLAPGAPALPRRALRSLHPSSAAPPRAPPTAPAAPFEPQLPCARTAPGAPSGREEPARPCLRLPPSPGTPGTGSASGGAPDPNPDPTEGAGSPPRPRRCPCPARVPAPGMERALLALCLCLLAPGECRALRGGLGGPWGRGWGRRRPLHPRCGPAGGRAAPGRLAQKLLHDLFANYSSALRPVEDTERALNVTLQVTLSQIIDMDERNQVLTSYLWVRQAWLDAHLTWDKDAYGGIDSIRIPSSYVWRPDIILYNNADDRFGGSMETNVVLRSDGLILWDAPAITKSSCKVDVSYFPFDGQRCRLTFGSWTYNGNQIDLRNRLDAGDLTDFVENVEWEVLGMPATRNVVTYGCCSEPYPDVTYTLVLRRRASFYIFNLLLPCLMVSFLAPLSFYLPADSGEKVSLGVTVLLALTVFQLLVAESMPPSESVPLIGKYYIATMTMMAASTALTILIMTVHHCGPGARPVPPWARSLILRHLARLCGLGGGCGAPGDAPREGGPSPGPCPRHRCLCPHGALLEHVAYIAGCFRRHRAAQRRSGDWKRVAKVLDRFFMWLFFLMVLLMSLLLLGKAA